MIAAAAGVTASIRLGSAVTVLSTEDPVRVFQQFATVDLLTGGRVELSAGRGSFIESFPLFGYDVADYDDLFEEKLELLLAINDNERVTWSGRFRPELVDARVLPRPSGGKLDIWIATGGNAQSSARAGLIGLPVTYAIIGGQPERFAPLVDLYRQARDHGGHAGPGKVAVAGFGFIADDDADRPRHVLPVLARGSGPDLPRARIRPADPGVLRRGVVVHRRDLRRLTRRGRRADRLPAAAPSAPTG